MTIVVTAADRTYSRTLWQMLRSAERHRLTDAHTFIAFDLGMLPAQQQQIRSSFPWCRLETFTFECYPPHVKRLVSCAWKPIAVEHVLEREGGFVLWLDSATLFRGPLTPIFERIARHGLFTLVGQSPLRRWCHPETFATWPYRRAIARSCAGSGERSVSTRDGPWCAISSPAGATARLWKLASTRPGRAARTIATIRPSSPTSSTSLSAIAASRSRPTRWTSVRASRCRG